MLNYWIYSGVAFLATMAFIFFLKSPAIHWRLVDYPGGRKTHENAVPLIGGVAIFCGFFLSVLIHGRFWNMHPSLFFACLLLVVVGVADDRHDLSARSRFAAQLLAAVLMTSWGGLYLGSLGDVFGFGIVHLHDWSIPFTVFCVVGVINALNMTDGVDGLAGGLSLLSLALFACVAFLSGMVSQFSLLLMLAGSLAGFLGFNFRHPWRSEAAIFLGDAGSMMLGFLLVWFSVALTQGERPAMSPMVAVWMIAVPLLDTVSIMIRRILHGRSPFAADREHLHHLLLFAGLPVGWVVGFILALAALLGAVGLVGWQLKVPDMAMFYGFIGVFVFYYSALEFAWRKRRASC
jgi:UDP-GlcNAc:undecaprenyl-phosphate GlcNAc-1-phosphate transferase